MTTNRTMKISVLFSLAVLAMSCHASEPEYVYVVHYGKGQRVGGDVATAQNAGTQVGGGASGNALGAAVALGSVLFSAAKTTNPDDVRYATVVGLNGKCEPTEISFPHRNWHYIKDGDRDTRLNAVAPMRWLQLTKNDSGEYVLDPLADRSSPRKSPCWNGYLSQMNTRTEKFNPESWYR